MKYYKRLVEATQGLLEKVETPKLELDSKSKNINKANNFIKHWARQKSWAKDDSVQGTQNFWSYWNSDYSYFKCLKMGNKLFNNLWDALKEERLEAQSNIKPPIDKMNFDQRTLELKIRLEYGHLVSKLSEMSKEAPLKMLPSYLGEFEERFEAMKLPSHHYKREKIMNIANLTTLMLTLIKCTLLLSKLLKLRPKLWKEVGNCL